MKQVLQSQRPEIHLQLFLVVEAVIKRPERFVDGSCCSQIQEHALVTLKTQNFECGMV